MVTVLVCLGCYNKIPQADWLLNYRNLFLNVLEARSPRSGYQHGWVLMTALFGVAVCQLLAVSSRGERDEGFFWGLFCKGTNPMCGLYPHDVIIFQSPPTS